MTRTPGRQEQSKHKPSDSRLLSPFLKCDARIYTGGKVADPREGFYAEPVKAGSGAPNIHNTTNKWISKTNQVESSDSASEVPARNTSGKMIPVSCTPQEHKEESEDRGSQQACTPLVSPVHIQGFLSAFDGAGDMPDSTEPAPHSDHCAEEDNSHVEATDSEEPNSTNCIWYMKTPRERPNSCEVLEFFKQIEIEETAMIEQYHREQLYDLGLVSDHEVDVVMADDSDEGESP
jgi:hypothetical protein